MNRGILKKCYLVLLWWCVVPTALGQQIGFSTVGFSDTAEKANKGFTNRARMITEWNACRKQLVTTIEGNELDWTTVAIAKLELARLARLGGPPPCLGTTDSDHLIAEVDRALGDPKLVALFPGWELGTSSKGDLPGCVRLGELDVALRGLVTILYHYGDLLSTNTKDRIVNQMLKPKVSGPPTSNPLSFELVTVCGIPTPETENHRNLIETTRYLTNQFLGIDNTANKNWILQRLKSYLQSDFQEYNSRHYQRYSLFAIQNLYDFAVDTDVKTAAQMVLDYVSAKFAVSSNGLRRAVPFRRRKEFKDYTDLLGNDSDEQTWRHLILAGIPENYKDHQVILDLRADEDSMQLAAVGSYRVPNMILDLILNRAHDSYYQRIRHDGVEVYASSPQVLISGGGIWVQSVHSEIQPKIYGDEILCYQDVGWPLPTIIIPTAGGMVDDYAKLIRINGWMTHEHVRLVPSCWKDYAGRINTCVAPGFACGINPTVPTNPAYVCADSSGKRIACGSHSGTGSVVPPLLGQVGPTQVDPWIFVDASAFNPGFYAAVYSDIWLIIPGTCVNNTPQGCTGRIGGETNTYGFIEVFDRTLNPGITFDDFRRGVLSRNGSRNYKSRTPVPGSEPLEYLTTAGRKIRFVPSTGNGLLWGIVSIDDKPMDTRIDHWPLAQGDVINSCEHSPCQPSDGHNGFVMISNSFLRRRLVLDFSRVSNPLRMEQCLEGSPGHEFWVQCPPPPPSPRPLSPNSGPFAQSWWGRQGNYEVLVGKGDHLFHYWRDNNTAGFPWHPGGDMPPAFSLIRGTGTPPVPGPIGPGGYAPSVSDNSSQGSGAVPVPRNPPSPGQPGSRSLPSNSRPSSGAVYISAQPAGISLIQTNMGSNPGDLVAVVRMSPKAHTPGAENGDYLASYVFDSASRKWLGPDPIVADGQPITGVTGTPSLIQSRWGSQGNFEVVVPQGDHLVHYWRDNDDLRTPWHRGGVMAGLSAGATTPGLHGQLQAPLPRARPIGVSLVQSNFGSPGDLLAVVRVAPPPLRPTSVSVGAGGALGSAGGPAQSQGSDYLVTYVFDSTSRQWRGPTPIIADGQPISGITGNPAAIQGRWGRQGNIELVVPQGDHLAHYWRDDDHVGFPWHRGGAMGAPSSATRTPGYQAMGQARLPEQPVGVALIQSNFGDPGDLVAVARMSPVGLLPRLSDPDLGTLVSPTGNDYLVTYVFESTSRQWRGPIPIEVDRQKITGVSAF